MADIGPTDMTAVSTLQMLALHRRQEAGSAQEAADGISHENLAGLLERDLQGSRRFKTLRGLLDLLCDDGADTRAAVAKVLDSVSWELFEATMGCLDESMPSSSSSTPGGAASSLLLHGEDGDRDDSNTETNTGNVDDSSSGNSGTPAELMEAAEVAVLSERLVLEMAEIFSPKELHVMALAHLPAYSGDRAVRAVLAALRRSTQRMPPLQRAKFLEAAIPPVIKATKRLAASAVSTDPVSSSDDDDEEQDSSSSGEGNHAHGLDIQPPPPPGEDDNPPREVYEAAASAAETAVAFVGPLLEQACAEGALARDGAALEASAAAQDPEKQSGKGERSAYPGAGNVAASDLAVAAYTGFALSALEISAETSASVAATATAPAATAAVSPAQASLESDSSAFAMKLAKAEERLVGLVMSSPAVDLPLLLLHGYRLSFDDRVKARGKGGGEATGSERPASCVSRGGLAGLAELTITGSSPWTLQGVSSFAYLVACQPGLRDKWLPLVWSRRTERRLFLPHAEVLMRSSSKRVARKGLELACFVGERLGTFPDETGAFGFEWEQDGGEVDGEVNGAWVGGSDEDLLAEEDEGTHRRHRQRGAFDPYYVDLASFLQVLVDVMVSCPLPGLRARGHAAMLAFLAATDEGSRFRALKRLIERCPWPNATGLLLDAFRREIDRALRCEPAERVFLTAEEAFLTAERASLTVERASLTVERASLASERASLAANKASLIAKQASLTAKQASLTAKQASLTEKQASLAAKQASLNALEESLTAASQGCDTSGTSSGGCSPSSTGNSRDSEETGGWELVGSGSSRTSDDTAETSTAGAAEASEAASLTALQASRTAARSSLAVKQASLTAAAQDCGTGGTRSGGCLPSSTGNSSDSGETGERERAGSGSSCIVDDAPEISAAEAAKVSEAASLTALQASLTAARSSLAAKQASLALAVARASLTAASQDCGTGGTSNGGCLRSSTGNNSDSGQAGGRKRVGLGSSRTADGAAEMSVAGAAEVAEAASLTALRASRTAKQASLAASQASLAAAAQDCGTGGTSSGGCLPSSTGNSIDSGEIGGRERAGSSSSCTADDAAEMSAAGAAEVSKAASLTALQASRTAARSSLAAAQASLALSVARASLTAPSQDRGTGNSSDSGEAGRRERVRPGSSCTLGDAAEMPAAGAAEVAETAAGPSPPRSCGDLEASPFASPLAGDFVCEQLRRACRKGPPASMLMDMDSRTGGLTLARYAHALDGAGGGGGSVGGMGARRERLMLREPQRLRNNQLLVEGFLSELRGAAITADSAGPVHFRLFILEDAAQQCLEELQRQSANPL